MGKKDRQGGKEGKRRIKDALFSVMKLCGKIRFVLVWQCNFTTYLCMRECACIKTHVHMLIYICTHECIHT